MMWWRGKRKGPDADLSPEQRVRRKYENFRRLLSFNNECLELLAGLQEDIQYVPARRDVFEERVGAIFGKAEGITEALESLTGRPFPSLATAVRGQRREVETYLAARQELETPRLSAWLSEIGMEAAAEVGGKAAALGEVKNRLRLPVPDGYILTTEAYRQFFGVPFWKTVRDAIRNLDPDDLGAIQAVSASLTAAVMSCPLPRAVEVALTERAATLGGAGLGLAVRSSAVGEGGARSFAGQFTSLINVPPEGLVDAYKRVVASRFSERALAYRLSTGLTEIESPMAVLCLRTIEARASGIMYTRDPRTPKGSDLWITATRGLGVEIASGQVPADLFVVSRSRAHVVLERNVVRKESRLVPLAGGGLASAPSSLDEARAPSLETEDLQVLADWGVRLEDHFGAPQDVEWAVDPDHGIWIVQSRPLALGPVSAPRFRPRTRGDLLIEGGMTAYPGRVSGKAYLVEEPRALAETPEGAVLFMRRASPDIITVFPRIVGLVAESGNVTGHAAALLREFKVPSVVQMAGAFERIRSGDPVSLDAVQPRVFAGTLWPSRPDSVVVRERYQDRREDPVSRRLLTLHLLDPSSFSFRPSGCKSTHDVLRFCHEQAIEAMFALNDSALERGPRACKRLLTPVPVNLYVLDLGGGLALKDPDAPEVKPSEIVCRPFRAVWRGITTPGVNWKREQPPSLDGLASVLAGSFSSHSAERRALGDRSYLLVSDEYLNLNSRLAYHFTLLDACVSDAASNNYISFRFAGGGATRWRRNLRACFIEACLAHYGMQVDRRGDVVNAWFKRAAAGETEARLDILGRLMASASQLDMYMTSQEVMRWYVRQFIEGSYEFREPEGGVGGPGLTAPR